jgi:hypothetical protein
MLPDSGPEYMGEYVTWTFSIFIFISIYVPNIDSNALNALPCAQGALGLLSLFLFLLLPWLLSASPNACSGAVIGLHVRCSTVDCMPAVCDQVSSSSRSSICRLCLSCVSGDVADLMCLAHVVCLRIWLVLCVWSIWCAWCLGMWLIWCV